MYANAITQERRQFYRMTIGEHDQIEAAVWTDNGDGLVGEVVDVSAQGVAVRVPRNASPVLCLGESVAFPFTPHSQTEPVALRAMVRSRNLTGKYWRYGFEFQLKNSRSVCFAEEFYGLFNRRDAFRVKPLREQPVSVTLADADASINPIATRLYDLSANGLGVLVQSNSDPSLTHDSLLHTTLRPPNSTRSVQLAGRIRHRTARNDTVCYGLEFDPDQCEQFDQHHEILVDYIIHRQLEDLATRPGPSSPRPPLPVRTTRVRPAPDQTGTA